MGCGKTGKRRKGGGETNLQGRGKVGFLGSKKFQENETK
jgi:hypothetical protein